MPQQPSLADPVSQERSLFRDDGSGCVAPDEIGRAVLPEPIVEPIDAGDTVVSTPAALRSRLGLKVKTSAGRTEMQTRIEN